MADYGIRFNGHHSSEFGLRVLQGKQIGFPTKIKSLVTIPHSSNEYDFSSVVGVQAYSDRIVSVPFHIKKTDKDSLYNEWTKIVNWLMSPSAKIPLYDDIMTDYYYMAEVREAPEFNEMLTRGTLTIQFTCYPFRISKLPEGNDIWDTFNFELDVAQSTSFDVLRTDFKPVSIGSIVNIGAWATTTDEGTPIPRSVISATYKVLDSKPTTRHRSEVAYLLEGLDDWIIEQDIVQAQNGVTHATLINSGTNAVVPTITTTDEITIKKGNQYFNLYDDVTKNGAFLIPPGTVELEITGIETTVDFEFYKEVI